MSIRREQWLLIAVIALGAWYWSTFEKPRSTRRVKPKVAEVEAAAEPRVVLAQPQLAFGALRDVTLEPSESSPLPPRELPFPALARLPVVLPPFLPGQATGQYYQLRHAKAPEPHLQFAAPDEGVVADANLDNGGDELAKKRLYDEIVFTNGNVLPVRILDQDKFQLAARKTIDVDFRYDWLSLQDGSVVKGNVLAEAKEVDGIRLADTIENQFGARVFALRGAGPAQAPKRRDLIADLLVHAPVYPEFYVIAEQQAQRLIDEADAKDGYLWMQRVLRAQGAIEREWNLYDGPDAPQDFAGSEEALRGRGEIAAMLTLWNIAESELRRAAEIDLDGRSSAALADYLLDRGRPAEALEFAETAIAKRARVNDLDARFEVGAIFVRTLLALGKLDEAKSAASRLGGSNGAAAEAAFYKGAVGYASGNYSAAASNFATASAVDALAPRARLGLGLCALAESKWDEAYANLTWVVDNAPALRHRAHASLAVLYELTMNLDRAVESIEQALLAAPEDPYSLYVHGRLLRLKGDFDAAVEKQTLALAQRDDLVESLAEIARALLTESRQPGIEDGADLLARGARYADRLVALDETRGRSRLFVELQGMIKFRLGEMAGAREAFELAVSRGSDLALIGLGAIDYRQLRAADARDGFVDLMNDPARPEPIREFARELVDKIDDHASKEQIRDSFDRSELGDLWEKNASGRVAARLDGDVVRFAGSPKAGAAWIRRTIDKGGNFLRAEARLTVARGTDVRFAGFELALAARNESQQNFRLRVGISMGTDQRMAPFVFLKDGRRDDSEESLVLDVPEFSPHEANAIAIEVVPGEKPKTFQLELSWNGEIVHTFAEVRTLRPATNTPIHVDIAVEGKSGGQVDVTVDDFRMNRRKTH